MTENAATLSEVVEYLKKNLRVEVNDNGWGDEVWYVEIYLGDNKISEAVLPIVD